jgi:hypothetical protein
MKERCIPLARPEEWNLALAGMKHDFAHTWDSCYAMSLTTRLPTYLYSFETEKGRVVCPVVERQFGEYMDIATPNGFSGFVTNGHVRDFPFHWSNFVRKKGYVCGYIALNPVFQHPWLYNTSDLDSSNYLYVLDLTKTETELVSNMDRNRRRQVWKWDLENKDFIFDKCILTEFILTHYNAFLQKIQASQSYFFTTETVEFLLNLRNVVAVGAGSAGCVETIVVIAYTQDIATSLFHFSLPGRRSHSTGLYWYAIRQLRSMQIPILNFGGGLTENDSIAEYKRRFGCRKFAFQSLKQVYRSELFKELCTRAGRDSEDRNGYFPPYRNIFKPAANT